MAATEQTDAKPKPKAHTAASHIKCYYCESQSDWRLIQFIIYVTIT